MIQSPCAGIKNGWKETDVSAGIAAKYETKTTPVLALIPNAQRGLLGYHPWQAAQCCEAVPLLMDL